MVAQKMVTAMDATTLLAIPLFILAGAIMGKGGISKRIIDLSYELFGWIPGSLGIVCVVSCMFFAALSGSSPATVAAIGGIMVPAMIDDGYPAGFSCSVAAAGGIIGCIIPPSIPFVNYGLITGESVGDLFAGGILPGILMGVALCVLVSIKSKKNGWGTTTKGINLWNLLNAFVRSILALLMPVIILGGIYGGIFTPTEAAAVSVVYGLIVGVFIYREVKLGDLYDLLVDSGKTTGGIMLIIGGATLFSYICTVHGISGAAQQLLLNISGNKYVFLLIVNVIFLIAGCFVDANSAMYIFIPIMFPVAQQLGIDPIHFGVLSTVNLAIGQVTPPVGVNLFVAIGVSDKLKGIKDTTRVTIETISKAVWPMIIACVITLMIVTYVPFFSTVFLGAAA